MKVAKIKNSNKKQTIEEINEQYSIKNLIIIIITLLVIFGIFYFITTLVLEKQEVEEVNTPAVLDSSLITMNQLLNRKEDEYYVIATKESLYKNSYLETNYIEIYNNYISSYIQKENALPFYYVDLDDAFNKGYLGEDVKISNELSELKLNDETLFKIKSNKIEKSYIGKDKIIEKLSGMQN